MTTITDVFLYFPQGGHAHYENVTDVRLVERGRLYFVSAIGSGIDTTLPFIVKSFIKEEASEPESATIPSSGAPSQQS